VDETLNALFQFDECAVVGEADDLPACTITEVILRLSVNPWVLTDLLEAQGDSFRLSVELKDLNRDLVANLDHL
jgi:hypothetical protein